MLLAYASNFLFDLPFQSQINFPPFWPCSVPQRLTSMGSITGFLQAGFQAGLANRRHWKEIPASRGGLGCARGRGTEVAAQGRDRARRLPQRPRIPRKEGEPKDLGVLLRNICLEEEKCGPGLGTPSPLSPVFGLLCSWLAPPTPCQAEPFLRTRPK